MASIVVRYPGRACLLGEHCDWAGGASLTIALPMGIEVKAEPETKGIHIHTDLDGELLEGSWSTHGEVNPAGGPLRFVPAACHRASALDGRPRRRLHSGVRWRKPRAGFFRVRGVAPWGAAPGVVVELSGNNALRNVLL